MFEPLTGATFVPPAFLVDKPCVVAGPCAHRLIARDGRSQHFSKLPADSGGQIVQLDSVRLHEREGALDKPFQLADVARPRIDSKRLLGLGGQRQVPSIPVTAQEVPHQFRYIFAAISQWRHVYLDAAETIVQVGTE